MLRGRRIDHDRHGSIVLLVVALALITNTGIAAECRVPRYRVGHVWEDNRASIMLNISIRMSDFAPDKLLCLSDALKRQYANRQRILIMMFSSHDAAKNYTTPIETYTIGPRTNWSRSNHATYAFNADKRDESLILMPIGQISTFATKIELPAASPPPCALQIAGRCLLGLDEIVFPEEARKSTASGTVTLEGVIDRRGQVRQLRVVDTEHSADASDSSFGRAALQNLSTWRFAPAREPTALRIAYEYLIAYESISSFPDNIRFDLPHKVGIRVEAPSRK